MATAGVTGTNQTIGASEELVYNGPNADNVGPNASVICVRNRADSGAVAIVRIPQIHGNSGGAPIPVGEKEYFRVHCGGAHHFQIYISGNGAKVDWYGVAKTRQGD